MWLTALYSPPGAAQRRLPTPASTAPLPTASTPLPSALNNGSPQEASKYYKELSGKLGLLTPSTIEAQANVKVMLDYLGYQELTPEDIEFATPESLMAPTPGKPGTGSQVLTVGSKVSLQSDMGSFFARCSNCQQSVKYGEQDSIATHVTSTSPLPVSTFEVVDAGQGKIALKADTGKFVARCLNCIIGGRVPDFVTVHAVGPTPPSFAQFTPEALPNGKIALKADTGKYVNRCRQCSSSATVSDTVTINVTDPLKDASAQWTVVTRDPGPTPAPALRTGEIIVSRFFAPKIVNFAVAPEQREVGWRRLVRINSRPGSEASKHFVESAWILFNHFTKPPTHSPFGGSNVPTQEVKPSPWGDVTVTTPPSKKNSSVNTQVALVTRCPESTPQCQEAKLNSIYWLDFGPSEKGYKLSYQLDAFFDAGALPGNGQAPYFVPNGCDTCHGSLRGNAVLNHLDTDHWLDRLTDGDFPALARPDAPAPLFDAGKNIQSPQYAAAFDVLRRLNEEIATMQQRTNPAGFHLAATRKWLEIHKTSVAPEPDLVKRSVNFFNTGHPLKKDRKPSSAPLNWTSSAEDRELLGLMNKYCYRCHGAVRFDIFSKDMVADESSPILDRLDPNPTQQKLIGFKMPVDREMDAKDKKRLMELIEKLYDQTH